MDQRGHGIGRRIARAAFLDDPAALHHEEAIGEGPGEIEVLLDDQERYAQVGAPPPTSAPSTFRPMLGWIASVRSASGSSCGCPEGAGPTASCCCSPPDRTP